MLIDGNSLTYRAFFALPTDLATAAGQVTNAVLGFTTMLTYLLREQKPDSIVVAFDRPEPTFRHERVPTYKGNRDAAPDILRQQMGLVRQVLDVLHITTVEAPGFEADDIIATLAEKAKGAGHEVMIVTGDRDAYQLVEDPRVRVLYNKRGVSDYALYDEAGIEERTGVTPAEYVQYAAMRGDNSDNLPGVPGVGEKTAAKLIKKYGGLDGIFAHLDEQTPKLRENLAAHEEQVRVNAEVMVLLRDLDIDVDFSTAVIDDVDPDEVRQLFDFLEFRGKFELLDEALGGRLGGGSGSGGRSAGAEVLEAEVTEVPSSAEAVALLGRLAEGTGPLVVAPAWSGEEGRSPLAGLAFVVDSATAEVGWLPDRVLAAVEVRDALAALLGPGGRPLAAHGAKATMRRLGEDGVDARSLAVDTMLAAYLLDPAEARYLLGDLLLRYANLELPDDSPAAEGQLDLDGGAVPPSLEAGRRALAVARLVNPLLEALDVQGLRHLYDDIEVPLVRVLAKMEEVGIAVDRTELESLNAALVTECATLTDQIKEDAGEDFNVNSTLQHREILFGEDKLALTPQKRTKTGYSTDAASLEKLLGQHPIIEHLLRYREVEKLRSTYGEGLLAEVAADGRIHATFNQTVARTGRLSSDAPNLHNIPVRTEGGRAFRRAFVPGPGYELLVADYNQIELR
ncbi:MAG: DNA polymerase I, partial [Acidimicrobiales bacterium]|nr:DNA polymerase I [Acidimicrobiales bacterium]